MTTYSVRCVTLSAVVGLALYAATNMMTGVGVLVDTVATVVRFAVAGGTIGAILGRR